MPADSSLGLSQILSSEMLNQVVSILQQMTTAIGEESLVITEASLPPEACLSEEIVRFVVLISQRFSGLLQAKALPESPVPDSSAPSAAASYQVELTFSPQAIAQFLTQLSHLFPAQSATQADLYQASQWLQPNHPDLQSQFTGQLLGLLAATSAVPPSPDAISCAPIVVMALQQQFEQERLLNQVTNQIRQSMDLPVILQTAVDHIQTLLQVDRAVIYEFNSTVLVSPSATSNPLGYGRITYEARSNEAISSVLNLVEGADCFTTGPNYREKYRKGHSLSIDDIDTALASYPCLLKLLQNAGVRAKLVVPIVVQEELWGLLIAHQCRTPRSWQEQEQTFLLRIAEHLAIAIYQANLYGQLQEQKQTLAQRVEERTQELFDALKAAQAANLTKSEFLATMSHELRTPLTSIIGMTTTLLRLKSGLNKDQIVSPERQQNYLQTIQRSGESLLQLINDILDLSEVEAGRTMLEIQSFWLSQLAAESLRPLQEKARQNSITLKLDLKFEPHSPDATSSYSDSFTADPRRIQQILQNLLSNAIKFTPAGGNVTLRIWRERETAVFQVEDTGIGIPDNQRSLLFTKFQQLDMSHHRTYEGIGVGLALTKQLVELHRGRIEVESTVNAGSTFTVWIPNQTGDPKKARSSSKNESLQFSQGRILLIEDDEAIATLICDLLTTAGYQVIWIEDGMTAIQQVSILNPLVAIVSTHLTDANAQEILLRLKDNPITANIRILVLSYDPSPEANANWLELGANECLTMSVFQPEHLLNQVAAIVQI